MSVTGVIQLPGWLLGQGLATKLLPCHPGHPMHPCGAATCAHDNLCHDNSNIKAFQRKLGTQIFNIKNIYYYKMTCA